MGRIFTTLNSINSFSKKIILFGSVFVVSCCIIGISLITYNHTFVGNVELYTIGSTLIQKSTIVFAQVTIGALVMDWFKNVFQDID